MKKEIPENFNTSIIMRDEAGDPFWVYINPPPDMYERAITQAELDSLQPEACYFDDVGSWSKGALKQAIYMVTEPEVKDSVEETDIELMKLSLEQHGVI